MIPKTKVCHKCQETKGKNSFFRNYDNPDNLDQYCMECRTRFTNSMKLELTTQKAPELKSEILPYD
jgi:hypothetical protein